MLVPVLRLPPRVVCLDHNHDGVHGVEFHGLPPLGGGRLLGDPPDHGGHFGGHPLEGDPPISQANYLCLTKRRLFKTQQFKSHFDQDQHRSRGHFCPETKNSILATFHLFPLKKPFFCAPLKSMSDTPRKKFKITTVICNKGQLSQPQAVSNICCKYLKNRDLSRN